MVLQTEEKDKTVQHILPHIQYKNDREVDKGMDSLKLTVSYYSLTHAHVRGVVVRQLTSNNNEIK